MPCFAKIVGEFEVFFYNKQITIVVMFTDIDELPNRSVVSFLLHMKIFELGYVRKLVPCFAKMVGKFEVFFITNK